MPTDNKPSIFYIFLSRKFWMSILSMAVSIGVLSFSDAEQAELVSMIVGGLGAVYTIAVAIEDGMSKQAEANAQKTTVSTPGESDVTVIAPNDTTPHVSSTGRIGH